MDIHNEPKLERQPSLDSAFSSLSGPWSHISMTSSSPSYKTSSTEVFTTSPKMPSLPQLNHFQGSCSPPVSQYQPPLLSHLDPQNSGFVSAQLLVHYWAGLGLQGTEGLLDELGLGAEEIVDRVGLTKRFREEIYQAMEIVSYGGAQAAMVTLLDEVASLRNSLDAISDERDKLRLDCQEAEQRNSSLVIEVDEQAYLHEKALQDEFQSMKKIWSDKLSKAEDKARVDRENHELAMHELKRTIDLERKKISDCQQRIEKENSEVEDKARRLQDDLDSTIIRIREVEEKNAFLIKEMENVRSLLYKSTADERNLKEPFNLDLISNVEDLVQANKDLKDRNDELESSMLDQNRSCVENSMKRKCCHLLESPETLSKCKITKKNAEERGSTNQENYFTNEPDDEDNIISFPDIWCSFDQEYKMLPNEEEHQKRSLEYELDLVKILADENQSEEEDHHHNCLANLEHENKSLRKYIKEASNENYRLLEENKHLEESLELMESEFESLENYWQQKLDAERVYYEELRKQNDIHCEEMKLRIKECEELLNKTESDTTEPFGKLQTIDEQRLLEESVNDWEEEITQLKIKLETVKMDHEDEISILKQEVHKIVNNFDENKDIKCSWCKNMLSLKQKRKTLENSWLAAVDAERESSLQQSKKVSFSSSSLPPYLSILDEKEQNRRQELRRYIEEDYDQMLLWKERLKVCPPQQIPIHIQEGVHKEHSEELNPSVQNNRGTQVPIAGEKYSRRNSIPSPAFQAILYDISSHVSRLHSEYSDAHCINSELITSIRSRLATQASRCWQVQSSLSLQKAQHDQEIAAAKEHHECEISQLESLSASTSELLRQQNRVYMEEMDRLDRSRGVIQGLLEASEEIRGKINTAQKIWRM